MTKGRCFSMHQRTILGDLIRYLDEYHWQWGITHKIINRWHGCNYTVSELKALYRTSR